MIYGFSIVVSFLPQAECGMNAIVLRLYEAYGSHSSALVESPVQFESVGRYVLGSHEYLLRV